MNQYHPVGLFASFICFVMQHNSGFN
jgi:hypothetical protein